MSSKQISAPGTTGNPPGVAQTPADRGSEAKTVADKSVSSTLEAEADIPTIPPDILYHAKCLEAANEVKVFFSEEPFAGLNLHGLNEGKPTSLLELVFNVRGKDIKNARKSDKYSGYESKKTRAKFGEDGDFIPESVDNLTLHIHSDHLRDEIQRVAGYYPSQNLNGDTVIIEYPYQILMHYISALKDAKKQYEECCEEVCNIELDESGAVVLPQEKEKSHALGVLLHFLIPIYVKEIEAGAVMQALPIPMTTWSMLWLLVKPGTDVYAKVGGKWRAFVVMSSKEIKPYTKKRPHYMEEPPPRTARMRINVWSLTVAGEGLLRRERCFDIDEFYGEREVSALSLVPCEVYDRLNGMGRRTELEERGAIFYNILKSLPKHFYYTGKAVAKLEKTRSWEESLKRLMDYNGDVVIDPAAYKKHGPVPVTNNPAFVRQKKAKRIPEDDSETGDEDEVRELGGEPEAFGGGPRWQSYNGIKPSEHEVLTKHQYMLLPADIRGFALKIKQWMAFDVRKVEEIKFPPKGEGAIDRLILDAQDVQYLKALSTKTSPTTSHVDFIKGKGEGQIFLFHGSPGTGKTYTVEAIAQYTNRPLLSLTVADLGLNEDKLEAQMTKWFQLATHWGAILLIDEADVFLEKRRSSNTRRNSLVSLFLRSMEYYSGLLFLTTNRPGAIDDAFRSRIHSAILFPNFDPSRSYLLWTAFLEKVKNENPTVRVTKAARDFIKNDKAVTKMDWSGREIRNAFTLALTLARYDHEMKSDKEDGDDEIVVRPEHFEDVILRRDGFIKYIDSIRDMKENERAYEVGDRRDATLDQDSD